MARGSGAGTGVIVALVVSIVCVIGLLTLTFMMYAGKTEAQRERAEAETALNEFVTSNERNNDSAKMIFDKAKQERKSAFAHMNARSQAISTFVTGSPNASVDEMRGSLQVGENMVVKTVISDLRRQLNSSKNDVLSLERKISDLQQDNSQLQARVEQAQSASEEQVASVTMTFEDYNQSTEEFQQKVDKAVTDINNSRVSLDRNYRNQLANLQGRLDTSNQDNSVLQSRIEELRLKTENIRLKPQNPAELVDGHVISVPSSNGEIFINLGKNNRVMPGMTFEVYNDPTAIRPNSKTGEYGRGKASIEIIRVGPDTSSARITRSIKGRPVVKDDVIANAVFHPGYKYKFLVYGNFDVNGDGRASKAESDYLKRQIIEWGGELLEGDELSGDLDYLVLGEQPPMPAPLPPDADDVAFRSFRQAREARQKYDQLFDKASQAQIPVLNHHRFEVLTGMTPGR